MRTLRGVPPLRSQQHVGCSGWRGDALPESATDTSAVVHRRGQLEMGLPAGNIISRIIEAPAVRDVWQLGVQGKLATLNFGKFPAETRPFLKHGAHWLLSQASPTTLRSY
ncbi:MAG TPA: hypothetical protein VMK12_04555 [Anaeromyxobacteraceae bacterium]|nr:hypothetical protein [Anaeromyxobacteraceae bacterium]